MCCTLKFVGADRGSVVLAGWLRGRGGLFWAIMLHCIVNMVLCFAGGKR
jgi:hypothetical protein